MESRNVAEEHPELVQKLSNKISRIVARGRSTPGAVQANDTDHWKGLSWFSAAEYEKLSAK